MTILEKCNQILNDKETNLLPDNLKTGTTCLGVKGTFTADADAIDTDIKAGKSGYVNGVKVTGTLPVQENNADIVLQNVSGVVGAENLDVSGNFADTFTNGTVVNNTQVIKSSVSLSTLAGLLGVTADRIKNGVTICGVEGNVIQLVGEEITVTPSKEGQVITPSEGKNGITQVEVSGEQNLVAENIKSGVSIFGVEGNYNGPAKTISSGEINDITIKAGTLQAALIELSVLTAEQTLPTLGYTTTIENDIITFNINSIGIYSIDSQDVVRNEQGEQVYPVVQSNPGEVETPIEGGLGTGSGEVF